MLALDKEVDDAGRTLPEYFRIERGLRPPQPGKEVQHR
jgi:hypothetical protein